MDEDLSRIEDIPSPSGSPAGPVHVALSAIVADAVADWGRIQGGIPEVLYHYTDVAGLIGILSSSSLWATNLRIRGE